MKKIKLSETRSFFKAVIVVVIAISIAMPLTYIALNDSTINTSAIGRLITSDTSTPEEPDPDSNNNNGETGNDDETIIFSSDNSGSSGDVFSGSGSSNQGSSSTGNSDDGNNKSNIFGLTAEPGIALRMTPYVTNGYWGRGEYDQDSSVPLGSIEGWFSRTGTMIIIESGQHKQQISILRLIGSDINMEFILDDPQICSGEFSGKLTYQGTTYSDILGNYWVDDCDATVDNPGTFIGNFVWNDELYWVYADFVGSY